MSDQSPKSRRPSWWAVLLIVCAWLAVGSPVQAQRTPVRRFDIAEGLVHSEVRSLLIDSRGFLWVGTSEGVSRFDGYGFRNYSLTDGLAHPFINDIAEGPDGTMWFATNGGGLNRLAVSPDSFRPPWGRPFETYALGDGLRSNLVNELAIDDAGRLWCATDDGVFWMDETGAAPAFHRVPMPAVPRVEARLIAPLPDGAVLVGIRTAFGPNQWVLMRLAIDGSDVSITPMDRFVGPPFMAALASEDRVQVGVGSEIVNYRRQGATGWTRERTSDRLPTVGSITSLHVDRRGVIWAGTDRDLWRHSGPTWQPVDVASGRRYMTTGMAQGVDGSVWVGSVGAALLQLLPLEIERWSMDDGLLNPDVRQVLELPDAPGRVVAVTARALVEVGAGRLRLTTLPGSDAGSFGVRLAPGADGGWWAMTPRAVLRIPTSDPDLRNATDRYPAPDGSEWIKTATETHAPFVDRAGRVWASTTQALYVLDERRGRGASFQRVPGAPGGLKPVHQDDRGRLWLGGNVALGVLDGSTFSRFVPTPGLPETEPRAVFADSRGWLWIGLRYRGVSFTRDPNADRPVFENLSTRAGLSSNTVWALCEDASGHVYLGTGRGLDRLEPATGAMRHFTAADGLTDDVVHACYGDSLSHMWVGTRRGLSRLDPASDDAAYPLPRVYLTQVVTAGETQPLPEWGATVVEGLALGPAQNNVLVGFVAPNLRREPLLYQYRLLGAHGEWGEPTSERVVNYARLAPGRYRFEVRAVTWDGRVSADAAAVAFRIRPPLWQQGWVVPLGLLVLVAGGAVYHRARVLRTVALERIRRSIAMDLHDDLGAGLAQVAILTEVARQKPDADRVHTLARIGALARSIRSSMDDIVWAVDPRKDHLADLVARVRQMATGTLEPHGVAVDVSVAPQGSGPIDLPPDARRHLLLFCTEAVTNTIRHATASVVTIAFHVRGGSLTVRVADDGRGFDPDTVSAGRGLTTLRVRIESMGGALTIVAVPGRGVTLEANVPLSLSRHRRRRAEGLSDTR